jgi:hypothetical protein
LTDAQAEALVALVRAAIDARAECTRRLYAEPLPADEAASADWHRRAAAAHDAALDARRAAEQAIRGHVSG